MIWISLAILAFAIIGIKWTIDENKKLKKELSVQNETVRNLDKLYTDQKIELESIKNGHIENSLNAFKSNLKEYLKGLDDESINELIDLAYESRVTDEDLKVESAPQGSVEDFGDNLSVIWAEDPIDIEFSYRDALNNKTRRNARLEEVSINNLGEPYFIAFCMEQIDIRHFKAKRIVSKIQYNGKKYSVEEFFSNVLLLDYNEL